MPECADLIEDIQRKLPKVFFTEQTTLFLPSSGTGMWEASVRNCINKKALNCVNGAFSDRFRLVTELNGKANEVLEVPWGEAIKPEQVAERLSTGEFDAITLVHNETSTGVTSPIKEIAEAVRSAPNGDDIMILVDSVSGLAGARIEVDAWDLDVVLSGSQKAFALPPGLAFVAVSDRAMAKAETVPNRGYYFDFLTLAKAMKKFQTPSTPAISLLYALNVQLEAMMEEGMEARFERHLAMRDYTLDWAASRGFTPYAEEGYRSPTVSTINNDHDIDIPALNTFLRTKGMFLSNGYGKFKGQNFRIGHMGDHQIADLEELFGHVDTFLSDNGISF